MFLCDMLGSICYNVAKLYLLNTNKVKYDFITLGGAVEDILIYTKQGIVIDNKKNQACPKLYGFEYGGKVLVEQAETSFGGGAANAAVAFSRLGFKVACIAAIGKDQRGADIIKNFKANKVNTSLIQKIKGQITGFSAIIAGRDREHVAFPVRGASHYLEIGRAEKKAIKNSFWLYLTSVSGEWQKILNQIFSDDITTKIAWNPGQVQLQAGLKVLKPYLAKTELLILNLDEAIELLLSATATKKPKLKTGLTIDEVAEKLKEYGPGQVLVTDGAKGAVLASDTGLSSFKPKKINDVLNTVGMGDAFGSSFLAGLELYQNDIKSAFELAGANSHRVARSHGAQPGLLFKKQIYEKI